MKKIASVILIICFIISACSQPQQETKTYILPNSYFEFTGSDVDEAVSSCMELGSDYCTDARKISDGMQLELTDQQLKNLMQRNDDFVDELAKQFAASNSMYRYVPDESYQELSLYFDENISSTLELKTILGIVSSYAMNYMLLNHTTDWNVGIKIYNCHTEKLVVSGNIPNEEISYGAKEWEASYNVQF